MFRTFEERIQSSPIHGLTSQRMNSNDILGWVIFALTTINSALWIMLANNQLPLEPIFTVSKISTKLNDFILWCKLHCYHTDV